MKSSLTQSNVSDDGNFAKRKKQYCNKEYAGRECALQQDAREGRHIPGLTVIKKTGIKAEIALGSLSLEGFSTPVAKCETDKSTEQKLRKSISAVSVSLKGFRLQRLRFGIMDRFEQGMRNARDKGDEARKEKKKEEESKQKDKLKSASPKQKTKMKNAMADKARRASSSAKDTALMDEIGKVRLSVNAKKSKSISQGGSPSQGGSSSQAGSSCSWTNPK